MTTCRARPTGVGGNARDEWRQPRERPRQEGLHDGLAVMLSDVLRDNGGRDASQPSVKRSTASKARERDAELAAWDPSGEQAKRLGGTGPVPRNPASAKDREGAQNQMKRNGPMQRHDAKLPASQQRRPSRKLVESR